MSPTKRNKGKSKKAKATTRHRKAARPKKAARKKPSRKASRRAAPVVFRKKGSEPAADTVDTLGEWQHGTEERDAGEFTEDDIPPDYGGSE